MCCFIDSSRSRYTPRSRTTVDGWIVDSPIWIEQSRVVSFARLDFDPTQIASVLLAFSWRLKSWLQLTYPLLIAASLDSFCLASTVKVSEKSSIMANRKFYTGFPTSHQPRFYAAPNFLKMGINYSICRLLGNFDNTGRKVCCKVSLYKNSQRQSCSAFNCLSSGINISYWQGTTLSLWNRGSKWPTPSWRQRFLTHFAL